MKYLRVSMFVLVLFLVACGKGEIETNMSSEVADFEFTTQDNEKLSLDDLKGEWWIADFIFTNCTSVCLPMTMNMAKLQTELAENDFDVQLISFSVDPEVDTPEVLKDYAEGYGANLSNWTFLTGYDFDTIQKFSLESFSSDVQEEPDSDQITHGVRFFLVNPDGEIIKNYYGIDDKSMSDVNVVEAIITDLEKVL